MSDSEDMSDSEKDEDWTEAFDATLCPQMPSFIDQTVMQPNDDNLKKVNADAKSETSVLSSSTHKPVTRMALNDNKAGMEGLDKEKINKIIHEASKGSKFYENEKRKEKRVLENIEAMKNDLKKYTANDHKRALVESNKVMEELSRGIDLSRTLVHIDMDAFYAAVEMRDDPTLRDVPMAVGSTGMLSTSNYAARKYGVRAAMPGFIGLKLCPQLRIVPTHFDKYRKVSSQVRSIFSDYDPNFLPMSLDEAYLDLTYFLMENGDKYESIDRSKSIIENIVDEIRNNIFEKTQLTASAGIGPNLMLSKICSDINKPNGQYYLKPDFELIKTFMNDLPIRKVSGVGRVTEQMLKAVDVNTCKDLIEKRALLYLMFSEGTFRYFMNIAFGKSTNVIIHDERKSMSAERTFNDVGDTESLLNICQDICKGLEEDLAKEKLKGFNVTLKFKLSTFVTKTRSKTLQYPVSKADELYQVSKDLLLKEIQNYGENRFVLRLMGVRVSSFKTKTKREQKTLDNLFSAQKIQVSESTKSPSSSERLKNFHKAEDSVQCPICGQYFLDDKISLNLHIDECLVSNDSNSIKNEPKNDLLTDSLTKADSFVLCPICNLSQENDELQLNRHIDECLKKKKQSSTNSDENIEVGTINDDNLKTEKLRETLISEEGSCPTSETLLTNSENNKENCFDASNSVICPICGKPQPNDETTLNSHIDNCLTKQTIRQIVNEQETELGEEDCIKTKTKMTLTNQSDSSRLSSKRKRGESSRSNKKVTLHSFWDKK